MKEFDPDAAAGEGSGIYGLPFTPAESRVVVVPVPYEATTSYGGGTSRGPAAVFEASISNSRRLHCSQTSSRCSALAAIKASGMAKNGMTQSDDFR